MERLLKEVLVTFGNYWIGEKAIAFRNGRSAANVKMIDIKDRDKIILSSF